MLNIFAFTSVAITYKAIEWWRTQHPGSILSFRTGGGNTDPAIEAMIYQNWLALLMLAIVMVALRFRQEEVKREIEGLRRLAYAR